MAPRSSSLIFLQYLTTVFDNIEDAITLISVEANESYKLLLANEAFWRTTGHTRDNIGRTMGHSLSKDVFDKLKKRYKRVISSKQSMEYTEWYSVPNGNYAFYIKLIPILNSTGECVQIAAITRDVTELHNLRKQQRDTSRQLEEILDRLHSS
jgi:PAS domain S-box-containing protein